MWCIINLMQRIYDSKIFQYLALPVIVLIVYIGLIFLYKFSGLPPAEEIIASAKNYYEIYGYWVVFIAALVEGALLINWYLPGGVVVLLGVVLSRESDINIFIVLALIVLGFFTTAVINYGFGRFGWYHVFLKLGLEKPLEKVKSKVKDKGLNVLFTTYIHPNFGALAATASGILRLPFYRFCLYSFVSIFLWNSMWATVFYYFGGGLLKHLNLIIIFGGVFVYFMFLKSFKEHRVDVP